MKFVDLTNGGNMDSINNQINRQFDEMKYVQYSIDFTRELTALESQLHSCEDPLQIAKDVLKAGAEFYEADWCGVIEGDLEMGAWAPVLWYNVESRAMTSTSFKELEETNNMERWLDALYACKPVIITDTEILKDSNPEEYSLYERCRAKAILAVPFWKNPIGFMIVRNPKRYNTDTYECGFLQALAFVAFSAMTE